MPKFNSVQWSTWPGPRVFAMARARAGPNICNILHFPHVLTLFGHFFSRCGDVGMQTNVYSSISKSKWGAWEEGVG